MKAGDGKPVYGLASLDISTGDFVVAEVEEAALGVEFARLEPSEIVAPESLFADPSFARLVKEARIAAAPFSRESAKAEDAERRVAEFYGVETLDGFGQFTRAEIAAAALGARLCQAHPDRCDAAPQPAAAPARAGRRWRSTPPPAPISN